jgi:hypothetical protein
VAGPRNIRPICGGRDAATDIRCNLNAAMPCEADRFERPRRLVTGPLLGATLLLAAACSSAGKCGNDASPQDYVVVEVSWGDLPAACSSGGPNEKGVGAACTMGGGECRRFGNSVCSCDPLIGYILPPDSPCVCIIPIVGMTCDQIPGDYCGTNASCCTYLAKGSTCFPSACLDTGMCPTFP